LELDEFDVKVLQLPQVLFVFELLSLGWVGLPFVVSPMVTTCGSASYIRSNPSQLLKAT
jgi:hypothetical protein